MLSDFCGLENVLVFVCVQTRLQSDPLFVSSIMLTEISLDIL